MSTEPVQRVRWHPVDGPETLACELATRIVDASVRAIDARGTFTLVLAGGNTPRAAYASMSDVVTDWSAWHIYFGDERCLPADDPARNSLMAAQCWLDHVPIPVCQRHLIAAELGPREAASRYRTTLEAAGSFDLVLLGLGDDGHTASLFPGHEWGARRDSATVLPVFDAPKPPAQRVSISARRLSRARAVVFAVAGDDKREAVRQWREGASIPARSITPKSGVDVLVDAALC